MQMMNLATFCLYVLVTCASGLEMQQPPWDPDLSSRVLEQPVTLSGKTGGLVTHAAGTSLLAESGRDVFMRTRQARIQNLLSAEQAALMSQEKAIEQIVAQQASLAQQQDELKRQEAKVDAEMAQRLAASGAILSQTAESSSGGIKARSRIRRVVEWVKKDWKEQLIGAVVWGIIVMIFGAIYAQYFTYGFPQLRNEPLVTREGFSFGLCDGYSCDPDSRICCFGHFCLPIRWADTASSPKIGFITFWTGLFLYTFAAALNSVSYGITGLICLVLAVMNRQQIRARYGMPNGTFSTFVADIAVWCCCIPCAAMQEALEIEFVDPLEMKKSVSVVSPMASTNGGASLAVSFVDRDKLVQAPISYIIHTSESLAPWNTPRFGAKEQPATEAAEEERKETEKLQKEKEDLLLKKQREAAQMEAEEERLRKTRQETTASPWASLTMDPPSKRSLSRAPMN